VADDLNTRAQSWTRSLRARNLSPPPSPRTPRRGASSSSSWTRTVCQPSRATFGAAPRGGIHLALGGPPPRVHRVGAVPPRCSSCPSRVISVAEVDLDDQVARVVGKGRRPRAAPFGAKASASLDRYLRVPVRGSRAPLSLRCGSVSVAGARWRNFGISQIISRRGTACAPGRYPGWGQSCRRPVRVGSARPRRVVGLAAKWSDGPAVFSLNPRGLHACASADATVRLALPVATGRTLSHGGPHAQRWLRRSAV
jgi:hypothetical protein